MDTFATIGVGSGIGYERDASLSNAQCASNGVVWWSEINLFIRACSRTHVLRLFTLSHGCTACAHTHVHVPVVYKAPYDGASPSVRAHHPHPRPTAHTYHTHLNVGVISKYISNPVPNYYSSGLYARSPYVWT